MILKLEVLNDPAHRGPAVFREKGGTLGRSERCTLLLPDQTVSSFHAQIHYENGTFLIEDTSRNGISINSPANRIVKGQLQQLADGDLILIDPYEISVKIESPAQPARRRESDPFEIDEPNLDPLVALGGGVQKSRPQGLKSDDLRPPDPSRDFYRPPDPILPEQPESTGGGGLIPDDWDKTGFGEKRPPKAEDGRPPRQPSPSPPPPTPPPSRPPAPASDSTPWGGTRVPGELSEVLKGAGLPSDLVTPELAQDFGRIIRIVISGLMDLLHARQQLKDEFGMQMTVFRPSRNNPLKFSANLEDALHNLLVKRNAAYLGPVEAFQDAYEDVLFHQLAVFAGIRAAFEAMLRAFRPDALQEEFDRRAKGSLISAPAKMRYWDQYKAKFDDMVADAEGSFDELFGQEFARAYDEQLERLKAERRARPDGRPEGSGRSRS